MAQLLFSALNRRPDHTMEPIQALQILDLTVPITRAALKKAYRDALLVWHPDRFEGNKDLRAKAEKRTYQINEAYAILKAAPESAYPFQTKDSSEESRGMPPPKAAAPPPQAAAPPPPPPTREPSPTPQGTCPAPANAGGVAGWGVAAVGAMILIAVVVHEKSSSIKNVVPANYHTLNVVTPAPLVELAVNAPIEEIRSRAEQGGKEAQFRLGEAYDTGAGVGKDSLEAMKWYRKAAEQGL